MKKIAAACVETEWETSRTGPGEREPRSSRFGSFRQYSGRTVNQPGARVFIAVAQEEFIAIRLQATY